LFSIEATENTQGNQCIAWARSIPFFAVHLGPSSALPCSDGLAGFAVAIARWWTPPALLGASLFAVGGPFALVWGFLVSTMLLWHGTFTINSLTHMFGTRRHPTTDNSRNNPVLAITPGLARRAAEASPAGIERTGPRNVTRAGQEGPRTGSRNEGEI
jgi:hypothetical protein